MKLLFVQLGDIHWRNDRPISEDRFTQIDHALRKIYPAAPDAVVFVYTGDFVHSGQAEEYIEIYSQLELVEGVIRNAYPSTPCFRVGVPGNHDCDFNVDQSAREHLLTHLMQDSKPKLEGQIVDVILSVQKNFWDFADAFLFDAEKGKRIWNNVDQRLAWSVQFDIGGFIIRFKCFNSAWLSRLYEKQGALLMPLQEVKSDDIINLDISLFHHPLTWIEATNSKASREHLLASSDLMFTGHEHESGSFHLTLNGKGEASVFEGGALWDPKNETHQFVSLLVDTEASTSELTEFSWKENGYVPFRDGVEYDPENPPLPLELRPNRFRRNSALSFTPSHADFLDRAEIDLTHAMHAKLELSKLFVFPDLTELNHPSKQGVSKTILGPKVFETLLNKSAVLLMGANGSGKTAIAKQFSRLAKDQGMLPIFVSGAELPSNVTALTAYLKSRIQSQYGHHAFDPYFNSPSSEKIIVIDDYDKIPGFWQNDYKLIEPLRTWFGRILFVSHDLSSGPMQVGKFLSAKTALEDSSSRAALLIQSLSSDRKNDIIEKWLGLDPDLVDNPQAYSRRFHEINRLMDTIIGREYLQPYPPYVLALLQGTEAGIDLDLSTSTHGYLYEVFIKNALAKRTTGTNHNIFTSFISFLAFRCLKEDRKQFGEDFLKEVHTWFEESTDLTRDLGSLRSELLKLRFLTESEGTFEFGEKYIFYYFSAFYIKDYISREEVSTFVKELASKLWVEDYANVMLFLTHLTKDRVVASSVIAAAASIFKEVPPATLEEDALAFFHRMADDIPFRISANGESTAETRKEEAKTVSCEVTLPSSHFVLDGRDSSFDQVSTLAKLNAAVKTVQILGQMLKNFPANFSPEEKVDIINGCIDLGHRTFSVYLEIAETEGDETVGHFVEMLRLQRGDDKPEDLEGEAKKIVFNLVYMVASGLTKRISYAIGSSELEKSYGKVFGDNLTPSRSLVRLSLALDHNGAFPERMIEIAAGSWKKTNPFALRILKGMVRRNFKQFHVGFNVRQRMCECLDISFKALPSVPSGQRIVSKKP